MKKSRNINESEVTEKKQSPRHVVQSYIVTRAMYDFNVYEKRVLYNLVKIAQSQIEGIKLSENLYKIDHSLSNAVSIELPLSCFLTSSDDKNHSRVKEALRSLHRKTFTYQDDQVWECYSIIANPRIRLGSSKVSFIVDSRVWDVILNFSKGFSRYDIDVAFSLESSYSMRFYEMLAGQEEPIAYSIDSLRKEFMLENKYALTKDFIRKVVVSAKDELDRKSPVSFDYVPLKEGKKIIGLRFFPIKISSNISPESFLAETVRKYGTGVMLSRDEIRYLYDIGFTDAGIKNNFGLLSECKSRMDLLYELAIISGKARDKRNPCGWCIKRLRCRLAELTAE